MVSHHPDDAAVQPGHLGQPPGRAGDKGEFACVRGKDDKPALGHCYVKPKSAAQLMSPEAVNSADAALATTDAPLERASTAENISSRSVNTSLDAASEPMNGSAETTSGSVSRTSDVNSEPVDRTAGVSSEAVNTAAEMTSQSVDTAEVLSESVNLTADVSTMPVNATAALSSNPVELTSEVQSRSVDTAVEISPKSLNTTAEITAEPVDTSENVSSETVNTTTEDMSSEPPNTAADISSDPLNTTADMCSKPLNTKDMYSELLDSKIDMYLEPSDTKADTYSELLDTKTDMYSKPMNTTADISSEAETISPDIAQQMTPEPQMPELISHHEKTAPITCPRPESSASVTAIESETIDATASSESDRKSCINATQSEEISLEIELLTSDHGMPSEPEAELGISHETESKELKVTQESCLTQQNTAQHVNSETDVKTFAKMPCESKDAAPETSISSEKAQDTPLAILQVPLDVGHDSMLIEDWDEELPVDGLQRSIEACSPCGPNIPTQIISVNFGLLHSGMVVMPGRRDKKGHAFVVMYLRKQNSGCTADNIAKLLMYLHTIPRKEVARKGFTIVVDSSACSKTAAEVFCQALITLNANISNAVYQVLVLAKPEKCHDRPTVWKNHLQCEVLTAEAELQSYVDKSSLPTDLGGTCGHNHEAWIAYRLKLEPFIVQCQLVAVHLLNTAAELQYKQQPSNVEGADHMMDLYRHLRKTTMSDPRYSNLQQEGDRLTRELENDDRLAPVRHTPDYRETMFRVGGMYREVQKTMIRVARFAEKRVSKLDKWRHVRTFQTEVKQVFTWIRNKGTPTLDKYQHLGSNLKDVRVQERDFEKFYFAAVKQIEKGKSLVQESAALVRDLSRQREVAESVEELARCLQQELAAFCLQLEQTRERTEDTADCYKILDQSYEWAVNMMKYLARMRIEEASNDADLCKLSTSLKSYLEEHPAISADTFDRVTHLAGKLGNDKLQEQCRVARARCTETQQLIGMRQAQADGGNARKQMNANAQPDAAAHIDGAVARVDGAAVHVDGAAVRVDGAGMCIDGATVPDLRPPLLLASRSVDDSTVAAATTFERLTHRRKSFGGVPSQRLVAPPPPPCGPRAAAAPWEEGISEIEEELFNEGLITEDLPVVTTEIPASALALRRGRRHGVTTPPPAPIRRCDALPGRVAWDGASGAVPPPDFADAEVFHSRSFTEGMMPPAPADPGTSVHNLSWQEPGSVTPDTQRRHVNLLTSHSISDFRPPGAARASRNLQMTISEMVQTEKDYAQALLYIIDNYFQEMLRDDLPQELRGKHGAIFGNIEKIYEFHSQHFLGELQTFRDTPFHVGQIFLRYENQFYLYAHYNKNKPKSDELLTQYGATFFKLKQRELGDKMDLASYLLKPVQRIGKYALLLKQILQECPVNDVYYQELKTAEEMVKFQLRHGNDLLAMDAIRDADVNVSEQGQLLRQDEFIVWRGRRKCLRHVFLFEDLILFSKTRKSISKGSQELYHYKHSIKMADIGLTENLGDSLTKFEIWFRRRKSGEAYALQASDVETKQAWARDVSMVLWRQARWSRNLRLHEMSSMGLGSRRMMDLKPSSNRIHDRAINISHMPSLQYAARTRNSISVSSFENNRPGSVISVCSSSSSNSSHSGASLATNCHLVDGSVSQSDVMRQSVLGDAPRATHVVSRRVSVPSSLESGIVADHCPSELSSDASSGVHSSETSDHSLPGGTINTDAACERTALSRLECMVDCNEAPAAIYLCDDDNAGKQPATDTNAHVLPPSVAMLAASPSYASPSAKSIGDVVGEENAAAQIVTDDGGVVSPSGDEPRDTSPTTKYVPCSADCGCSGSCTIPMTEL
ncbi:PREDICTED: uncharacterized protein LOC106811518 [Priapulus caudatus]|uniref:Uncharacterized protein LOC106811518 n=1 Tax=Priapulus caudatus TaxID=37621 RepID=A0ABM1EEP5_PRICU|nr:PREDICTED: uncharacterized protein LOC106811518 [Priapulus caudatus]